MLDIFSTPEGWVSLATLTTLEIVLGIDNIVFITILSGKLPENQQHLARRLGLGFALITRLLLLGTITWIMGLDQTLFTVLDIAVSGRSIILMVGGVFLLTKATLEIYDKLEVEHGPTDVPKGASTLTWVVIQIMLLDIVFSLDSVITAVGMVGQLSIMMLAVVLAVIIMMVFAGPVGDFINRHPSLKILALAFLLMVGVLLVAEALGQHINKGYVYFAMAFSLLVEVINIRTRRAQASPLALHGPFRSEEENMRAAKTWAP